MGVKQYNIAAHMWFLFQPALVLIHEACLGGVDVSTLDLLLNIQAEKDHDINSKSEVNTTSMCRLQSNPITLLTGTFMCAVWSDTTSCCLWQPQVSS